METEIKLRVANADDARVRLRRAGATSRSPRLLEDNRLFDDAAGSLAAGRRILRLRTYGGRHIVTYKAPGPEGVEGRHRVRIEHETEVADGAAFEELLLGLGYRQVWRYQKYREGYALSGAKVELDETPIGTFVEIEGEGAAIDEAAERLGYAGEPYEKRSYRELAEEAAGGGACGDLVFRDAAP